MDSVGSNRQRVVINVDDDWMARAGVRAACLSIDDTLDIVDMSFTEALERTDWAGVDFVFVDLSHPRPDDIDADEFPGIGVAEHVRTFAPGHGPHVILLTGEYEKSNDPFVLRRARESRADHLMYRTAFTEQLQAILDGTLTDVVPLAVDKRGDEPGLGVTGRSKLNEAIADIAGLGILTRRAVGGTGNKQRALVAKAAGLIRVTPKGQPAAGLPRTAQLRQLRRRATRLDPDR